MSKTLSKIISIFVIVGIITFGWYRWSSNETSSNLMDMASGKRLIVVNVLDLDQYQDCHIKGSINIPFDQLEDFAKNLNKDTELVFYCSNYMCAGSGKAARLFKQKGFKNVWAYEAGMTEWYKKGLPFEGNCRATYLKMRNEPLELEQHNDFEIISTEELKAKLGI